MRLMKFSAIVLMTVTLAGCDDAKEVVDKVQEDIEKAIGWVDENTDPTPACTPDAEDWPECLEF